MLAPLALDDAGWAAVASMVASVSALVAVLVGNRRGSVIEKKVEPVAQTVEAIHHSVTTPNGDPRTLAEIVSEAHPDS